MPHRFWPLVIQASATLGANLLLAGSGLAAPAAGAAGVPALYPTQAEAEQAARQHFNCTGAHRMGNQWMPCAQHGTHNGTTHAH
jgi:hypothetical protein